MFGLRKDWIQLRDAYQELRVSQGRSKERDESLKWMFQLYFQEMISSRRADNTPGSHTQAEEQHDLFNQLILAHDDTNTLSEEELIGTSEHNYV